MRRLIALAINYSRYFIIVEDNNIARKKKNGDDIHIHITSTNC